jgi:hypothetical protein
VLRASAGQDDGVTTQEDRWRRAERTLDVEAARRVRRTPTVVIGLTGLLVLAVSLTAVVDLRRLQTPRGAALAWASAATFGECRGYQRLSVDVGPTPAPTCRELRAATAADRAEASHLSLRAASVTVTGTTAIVVVELRGPQGPRSVTLHLVRSGDAWLVQREPGLCAAGCY